MRTVFFILISFLIVGFGCGGIVEDEQLNDPSFAMGSGGCSSDYNEKALTLKIVGAQLDDETANTFELGDIKIYKPGTFPIQSLIGGFVCPYFDDGTCRYSNAKEGRAFWDKSLHYEWDSSPTYTMSQQNPFLAIEFRHEGGLLQYSLYPYTDCIIQDFYQLLSDKGIDINRTSSFDVDINESDCNVNLGKDGLLNYATIHVETSSIPNQAHQLSLSYSELNILNNALWGETNTYYGPDGFPNQFVIVTLPGGKTITSQIHNNSIGVNWNLPLGIACTDTWTQPILIEGFDCDGNDCVTNPEHRQILFRTEITLNPLRFSPTAAGDHEITLTSDDNVAYRYAEMKFKDYESDSPALLSQLKFEITDVE